VTSYSNTELFASSSKCSTLVGLFLLLAMWLTAFSKKKLLLWYYFVHCLTLTMLISIIGIWSAI
jgi:hypothetical protein